MSLNMAETLETLTDNSQETEYSEEEDDVDLSLLRLNSFGNRTNSSPPQYQSYVSSSSASPVKRASPESKEAAAEEEEEQPRGKKLFLPPRPEQEDDKRMSSLMGYSKLPLPMASEPSRVRSSPPLHKRSLSDTFASRNAAVPSLPPRPPLFQRSVSDVSPSVASKTRLGSSLVPQENSEANKMEMLYVIKDGVRELDQWCNKLLKYGEAAVKQDCTYTPKAEEEERMQAEEDAQEESQKEECKEGVKVDRVGEAFVVEINCPCGRNYRTLFSGRDCYYKLL